MANCLRRFAWVCGFFLLVGSAVRAGNWPQWRGPAGDSVSDETGLPLRWSEMDNVRWKCALPGWGASTPAIWGDAVFLTSQIDDKLLLLKIDKTTGHIEWTRDVGTGTVQGVVPQAKRGDDRRKQKFHRLHNMASPSPVTDGRLVVVHFGNGDLAAYDFAGKRLWQRNLQQDHGAFTIWWGHANSPVLYQDLVIAVSMQDSLSDLPGEPVPSYIVAYDKQTGAKRWQTTRKTAAKAEQCDSYTTPIFHRGKDVVEMILMGANQLDGYDPLTGNQRWHLPGLQGNRTITGPTLGDDMVYTTQGRRGPLLGVRLGGTGQVSPEAIVWKETQGTPDTCCPVIWHNLLFTISDNGIAQCHDAKTGKLHWKERLPGDYKASPATAEKKVYFLNLAGQCTTVAAEPIFKKLAVNQVKDETIASPAFSDGRIYMRGRTNLYCLGAP